jgi:hypothetical protein
MHSDDYVAADMQVQGRAWIFRCRMHRSKCVCRNSYNDDSGQPCSMRQRRHKTGCNDRDDRKKASINMIFQHEFTLVVAGAFTCLQELQRKPNGRVSGPTYFFRDCRKKRRDAEGHRQLNCALFEVKHRGDARVAHARRRPRASRTKRWRADSSPIN